jgi:hypothetical protein
MSPADQQRNLPPEVGGLRATLAGLAGGFLALLVGWALFVVIFVSPTFFTDPQIMLLAGWFMWIPAGLVAVPVGLFVGKATTRALRSPGARGFKDAVLALLLVSMAFCLHVLVNGLYDREFTLAWREPVQLVDGTVVQVQRKHEYRRPGSALSKYADAVREAEELTLDAGQGPVTLKTSGRLVHLNRIDGVWYAVLAMDHRMGQDAWGKDFNTMQQRLLVLKDGRFHGAPWSTAPGAIVLHNLLGETFTAQDVVGWQAKPLDLQRKRTLLRRALRERPRPDALRITRPSKTDQLKDQYRAAFDAL